MEAQISTRMLGYSCAFFFTLVWGFVGLLYQVTKVLYSLGSC